MEENKKELPKMDTIREFNSKEEERQFAQSIRKVSLTLQNGEVKEFNIDEGVFLVCDTTDENMVSIMQCDTEYAVHVLNIVISLIIRAAIKEGNMELLYEQTRSITQGTVVKIKEFIRNYMLMKHAPPTQKGKEN